MGQAKRLTLADATTWAVWQAGVTGFSHSVWRVDPIQRVHGLSGLRKVLPRFFVRPAGGNGPPGGHLETTVHPDSENREKDSTSAPDAR